MDKSLWSIRLTAIVPSYKYRSNKHENVIATDISEAIALVLEKYKDQEPVVHSAQHQGTVTMGSNFIGGS